MVENTSWLGMAWARMIPTYPSRTLSDRQVSSGIATRLLLSGEPADLCAQCHQPAGFLHGDVCELRRHNPGKARHNAFRYLLGRQAQATGSTVAIEYAADAPGANPLFRGNLLLTGAAAPDGVAGAVDITFTAPAGTRNQQRIAGVARLEGETLWAFTKRQLRRLTAVREADKRRKYVGAFVQPLLPAVFTSGGYPSPQTKAWLTRLEVFTRGKLAAAFDLSVALVRARASLN